MEIVVPCCLWKSCIACGSNAFHEHEPRSALAPMMARLWPMASLCGRAVACGLIAWHDCGLWPHCAARQGCGPWPHRVARQGLWPMASLCGTARAVAYATVTSASKSWQQISVAETGPVCRHVHRHGRKHVYGRVCRHVYGLVCRYGRVCSKAGRSTLSSRPSLRKVRARATTSNCSPSTTQVAYIAMA